MTISSAVKRVQADRQGKTQRGKPRDEVLRQPRSIGDQAHVQSKESEILQHVEQVETQERLSTLKEDKPNAFGMEISKDTSDFLPAEFVPSLV